MYRSLFGGDLFAQIDRLQRQMQQAFDLTSPSIRGWAGGFPAVNVGHTPASTEIYAFVPGVDPAQIGVTIDRGAPRVRIPKAEHAQPRRIEVSVA